MNLKQQTFITEYLRRNDAFTAYCIAYNLKDCSNYTSIMSSANRLLNTPEVAETIRTIMDGIRYDVEQEIKAEMKRELLTVQRKRELLAQIATGEMYVMQYYKGKDCNQCSQHVAPTINQMLRAIDLDSRLAGHYPDVKRNTKQNIAAVEKLEQQLAKEEQTTTNHNKSGDVYNRSAGEIESLEIHDSSVENPFDSNADDVTRDEGILLKLRSETTVVKKNINHNNYGVIDNRQCRSILQQGVVDCDNIRYNT